MSVLRCLLVLPVCFAGTFGAEKGNSKYGSSEDTLLLESEGAALAVFLTLAFMMVLGMRMITHDESKLKPKSYEEQRAEAEPPRVEHASEKVL